jgi:phosphoglycolate phosphatase
MKIPRQFSLLVFDWDGTLMDSAGAIVASLLASCRDLDLPEPSDAQARHIIGLGMNEAIAELLPQLDAADYPRFTERYRHHFLGQDHEIPLFAGVHDAISGLHDAGFMLAVATGKSRRGLDRVLRHTGLDEFFQGSRCADESLSKPHPAMLMELMDDFAVGPQQTLMIGDTTHDLQMARNAGVPGLGAAYGAHPKENLLSLAPLACADSFTELHQWLTTNA